MVHVEESLQLPRDFEGKRSQCGHDPQWPEGARIAVSFVLNYEEGGERNPLDGDGTSEPYLWEKGPSGGGREQRHLNGEQDYEYGSRCGAWRILRLMKEFGWNMTLWAIAVAMERNPTFAQACVRDGHEIGAHGYRWLDIWDYSLEDDKAYIKKTCTALEAATGEFPVGAYFGRGTPNTASLLPIMWKEMGHKMLYTSEVYNEDSPYWIDLPWEKELPDNEKEGLLMMPYNYDCNDGKFHMLPGFVSSNGATYEQCQDAAEAAVFDQTNLLPQRQLVTVLCVLAASMFISFVEQNGISVAVPTIGEELRAEEIISWIGTSALIANTMFQVFYGRLSDLYGRKSVFLSALALLAVSELVCGFSRHATMLFVFRGLTGVANGGITALTMMIVSDIVTLKERGKYQGILGSCVGAGSIAGPFIAAAFTQPGTWANTSWRGFFWLVGALAFGAGVVA
ncbi:hypothetical protein E8E12_001820 [Didymella heteroderae]|uniref:Major facilitator superfamily (MFS) profile domain-containing protein n=1 Tax=Didymella heteroderae TaxID=1769908 RepID=A0A9P5BVN9_9PLEO|nr:hypothetical protein E8E12_001820 [Didymella heteroderae]